MTGKPITRRCLKCGTPHTNTGPRCQPCRTSSPPRRPPAHVRYPPEYRANRAHLLAACHSGTPCGICGQPLGTDTRQWTADHIHPRNRGGTHTLDNLQPAHHHCNSAKRDT